MNNKPNNENQKKVEVTTEKQGQAPLLKIKPLNKLKTSIRAGGSIVGLGAAF